MGHLKEVGEGYFVHMKTAGLISVRLLISSALQMVHAIFPFVPVPSGFDIDSLVRVLTHSSPKNRKILKD